MDFRFFLLVALVVVFTPLHSAEVIIGTGSKSGVYFQAGRAICRLIKRNIPGTTCTALESAGSVSNLINVEAGALELGLVQSDLQYHAFHHSGPFEFVDTPYASLRSLFSLYTEPFTLVTRRDADIRTLDDLKGRRVNIGNPGSGQRATMEVVMAAKGWSKDDFQLVTELPAAQQSLALCHDRVQAMVYTVGHPNFSVSKALSLCEATITEVSGPGIDRLVSETPYYAPTLIPPGVYPGIVKPVPTFGVLATVVSSSDVDEDQIYQIVKSVFDNLDYFRRMHVVFKDLRPEAMITDGLSAPLHEGAKRYYRERGWIPQDQVAVEPSE